MSHVLRSGPGPARCAGCRPDGIAVHNEQGRAIRSLGALIDITDHRNAKWHWSDSRLKTS